MFKRAGVGEAATAGTAGTKLTGKSKGRKHTNNSILSIQHLAKGIQPATCAEKQ